MREWKKIWEKKGSFAVKILKKEMIRNNLEAHKSLIFLFYFLKPKLNIFNFHF